MRISDWSSDVCSSDLSEAMTERSNLLRRHFVGTAAGLVDVVATGVVGNFGGLAGRVFERGRLHRPLGRRLRFDRVGLGLGKRVGAAGHGISPWIDQRMGATHVPPAEAEHVPPAEEGGFAPLPSATRLL